MNNSLVLVGMNVRPLAQSAVKAGFEVVAMDAFGLLDLPEEARCLSVLRDLGGLFPFDPHSWHMRLAQAARLEKTNCLAYSGGFENLPDLVAEMREDRELLGNSPAKIALYSAQIARLLAAESAGWKEHHDTLPLSGSSANSFDD